MSGGLGNQRFINKFQNNSGVFTLRGRARCKFANEMRDPLNPPEKGDFNVNPNDNVNDNDNLKLETRNNNNY